MERVGVNGVELAYQESGDPAGPPVLLIHGAVFADGMAPFARHASMQPFRMLRHHRRGYGSSDKTAGVTSVATHAGDAAALIEVLGLGAAHVVGHSYGGGTALQLAVDCPELVASLVLLEPAVTGMAPGETSGDVLRPIFKAYGLGDHETAIDLFVATIGARGWRSDVERALGPTAAALAVVDAAAAIGSDLASLASFQCGADEIRRITAPTAFIQGADSDALATEVFGAPIYSTTAGILRSALPDLREAVLPRATHMLQLHQPDLAAELVAEQLSYFL